MALFIGVDTQGQVEERWLEPVEALAQQALQALGLDQVELSVLLCDDEVIAALNTEWREVEGPTDVLSFPQEEDEWALPEGMPRALGDVVISLDTAQRQATALGHGLEQELRVLLVHGLLHLLGHDHEEDEEEAAAMREAEAGLLAAMGQSEAGLIARSG